MNGCNNPSFNNMFSFGNVFRRWLSTHQLVNGCSSPASKCVFLWKCMQTVPERTSTLNGYSNPASTYLGAQMLSRVSRCVRRRMYTIVSTYGGVCVYTNAYLRARFVSGIATPDWVAKTNHRYRRCICGSQASTKLTEHSACPSRRPSMLGGYRCNIRKICR